MPLLLASPGQSLPESGECSSASRTSSLVKHQLTQRMSTSRGMNLLRTSRPHCVRRFIQRQHGIAAICICNTAHSDGSCTSLAGAKVPCPVFVTLEAAAHRGLDFVAV